MSGPFIKNITNEILLIDLSIPRLVQAPTLRPGRTTPFTTIRVPARGSVDLSKELGITTEQAVRVLEESPIGPFEKKMRIVYDEIDGAQKRPRYDAESVAKKAAEKAAKVAEIRKRLQEGLPEKPVTPVPTGAERAKEVNAPMASIEAIAQEAAKVVDDLTPSTRWSMERLQAEATKRGIPWDEETSKNTLLRKLRQT